MLEILVDSEGIVEKVVQLSYVQTEDDLLQRLSFRLEVLERYSLVCGDLDFMFNSKRLDEERAYLIKGGGYLLYVEDRADIMEGERIVISPREGKVSVLDDHRNPIKMDYDAEDIKSAFSNGTYGHDIF